MRERPILFSAPMVRALLAGTKTQTRRIVKAPRGLAPMTDKLWTFDQITVNVPCPYGTPGDRLWVKETWGYRGRGVHFRGASDNGATTDISIEYAADKLKRSIIRPSEGIDEQLPDQHCLPKLKGHDTRGPEHYDKCLTAHWRSWRPSIFMRRWMSRITLEVTAVRVERLQSISKEDAIAEGIERHEIHTARVGRGADVSVIWRDYAGPNDPFEWFGDPRDSYRSLWESINGAGSWAANPWVWVVGFARLP